LQHCELPEASRGISFPLFPHLDVSVTVFLTLHLPGDDIPCISCQSMTNKSIGLQIANTSAQNQNVMNETGEWVDNPAEMDSF
jgi:hypothetical protein